MKRRARHDDTEGWTSGGDLADVEETPRSRSSIPSVHPICFGKLLTMLEQRRT